MQAWVDISYLQPILSFNREFSQNTRSKCHKPVINFKGEGGCDSDDELYYCLHQPSSFWRVDERHRY